MSIGSLLFYTISLNKTIRFTMYTTKQSNGFSILGKTAQASPQSNSSTPRAGATAWAEVLPIGAISLVDAAVEIKEDLSFEISPADASKLKREQKLALKRVLHEQDLASGVVAIRRNHPLIRSGSPSKAQASAGGGIAATTRNPRQASAFRPVTGETLRETVEKMRESQTQREQRHAEALADPRKKAARARNEYLASKSESAIKKALDEGADYIVNGITNPKVVSAMNFNLGWVKNGRVQDTTPHAFTAVHGCDPNLQFQGIPFHMMFEDSRLRLPLGAIVAHKWETLTADLNRKSIKPVRATVVFNESTGIVKLDMWALTYEEIAIREAESAAAEAARTAQAAQEAEAAQAAAEAEEAKREADAMANPWGAAAGGGH